MVLLIVTMGENNIQLTIQFRVSFRIFRKGGKLDYPNIMGGGARLQAPPRSFGFFSVLTGAILAAVLQHPESGYFSIS